MSKKPLYKKWWFWTVIVFIVIGLSSSGQSDNNTSQNHVESTTEEEAAASNGETNVEDSNDTEESLESTSHEDARQQPEQNDQLVISNQPVNGISPSNSSSSLADTKADETTRLPLKAVCKDGSVSYQDNPSLDNYRGMCSKHGGISKKLGRVK